MIADDTNVYEGGVPKQYFSNWGDLQTERRDKH